MARVNKRIDESQCTLISMTGCNVAHYCSHCNVLSLRVVYLVLLRDTQST